MSHPQPVAILSLEGMSGFIERRKYARIALKGTAILLAGEHAVRARIVNLSEGGFFATTLVTAPRRLLGRSVDIELRLDDRLSQWIRLEGKVVRIGNESVTVSLEATSSLVRLVDAMATASRARERVITVVLIDEDTARLSLLAEGFRLVGCSVIEATTSLEAIVRLGESSFEPDVIVVADSIPATTANEMRDFVGRNHPNVKLVSLTDALIDPLGDIHHLSPDDIAGNLAGAIRRLLAQPRSATS